ncbi:hypothetical protein B0T22DRAFT_153162 [Podospora appendiculata]|uniref:DNA mismatch repair protein PMS1 n=1 Tax=Podospora appendiculata TaxID=314037 RepID=A0AAE0XA24_9PEZI|nr:hypothetical protein B0T22DRAFT_153162 [Podospora appendiculata]
MASDGTIKAIDRGAVHQIQSGQVIVDLCSVAKELVENAIDAGSTTIDVRFKNQGLDSIEVQDNGAGISPANYAAIGLKHYTSKLSTYDDLSRLQTFGFRGEALSSLCALSHFSMVTCTQQEAPRATKLEFEISGQLKSTAVVSGQKGTTVLVEDLFRNLPVRRRELERNIKRDWGKVIGLLNQYACVQTGLKFTVSQQPTKGKRMVLFSTKGNATTRDNIINVFGVKTMSALITMDLKLDLTPTAGPVKRGTARDEGGTTEIRVRGHVSRPTHGEGRQTPDRQMFYVNGRPCGLPQFAKVFNEVYRSYNSSQSPFIFADIQLDTHLYDVNVSPDKRSILLHDQGQMLDSLRESLIELFETQDVTIPVAQTPSHSHTPFKKPANTQSDTPASTTPRSIGVMNPVSQHTRGTTRSERSDGTEDKAIEDDDDNAHDLSQMADEEDEEEEEEEEVEEEDQEREEDEVEDEGERRTQPRISNKKSNLASLASTNPKGTALLSNWLVRKSDLRERSDATTVVSHRGNQVRNSNGKPRLTDEAMEDQDIQEEEPSARRDGKDSPDDQAVEDQNMPAIPGTMPQEVDEEMEVEVDEPRVSALHPPTQRPGPGSISMTRPLKRSTQEMATITIGDHSVTGVIGSSPKRPKRTAESNMPNSTALAMAGKRVVSLPSFGGRLSQMFSASARAGGGSVEGLDVTTKDVTVSFQDEEEGEEEESLFVSQPENEVSHIDDHEDDEMREEDVHVQNTESKDGAERCSHAHDNNIGANSPLESCVHSPDGVVDDEDEDEYVDEEEKKAREDKKVQELIDTAEVKPSVSTEDSEKRSQMLLKGRIKRKDMTLGLVQRLKTSEGAIRGLASTLAKLLPLPSPLSSTTGRRGEGEPSGSLDAEDAEEKLALKISKSDFAKMRIIGQFNLGFVLAVREATATSTQDDDNPFEIASPNNDDELFIIDQHASDEKFNFERLQATTTVQSQRLVQPKTLELTAVEEEIIIEHAAALQKNGFDVAVDQTGDKPVGARCQLLSLPLSRETTFSLADLEELIFLLGDNPSSSATTVPRPSKVRKMFAMRACRSSVMIGKALSGRQMEKIVRHMGEMEKPWNCPHGRPTMRHLCGLSAWEERTWTEGDGAVVDRGGRTDWAGWVRDKKR